MSSNRNTRNPQQLRALIQNMGRSIDEARSRRLGPDSPKQPLPAIRSELRADQSAPVPSAREPDIQRPGASSGPAPTPSAAPPVRGANEMFDGAAPRLKARPKRAS